MPAGARGFSLVESLVALLLVMVGLTGGVHLHAAMLAASANAKAGDEATALALEVLTDFQAVASYAEYRDRIVPGDAVRQGLLHRYRLDWSVDHSDTPDFKRVEVRVGWPADAPANLVRIETLIPGLDIGRFARQQLNR